MTREQAAAGNLVAIKNIAAYARNTGAAGRFNHQLLAVRVAAGAVHIALLRHLAVEVVGLVGAVRVFVPQQRATGALFGFQRRLVGFQLLDKLRGFRGVVGAAKKGHGVEQL